MGMKGIFDRNTVNRETAGDILKAMVELGGALNMIHKLTDRKKEFTDAYDTIKALGVKDVDILRATGHILSTVFALCMKTAMKVDNGQMVEGVQRHPDLVEQLNAKGVKSQEEMEDAILYAAERRSIDLTKALTTLFDMIETADRRGGVISVDDAAENKEQEG